MGTSKLSPKKESTVVPKCAPIASSYFAPNAAQYRAIAPGSRWSTASALSRCVSQNAISCQRPSGTAQVMASPRSRCDKSMSVSAHSLSPSMRAATAFVKWSSSAITGVERGTSRGFSAACLGSAPEKVRGPSTCMALARRTLLWSSLGTQSPPQIQPGPPKLTENCMPRLPASSTAKRSSSKYSRDR